MNIVSSKTTVCRPTAATLQFTSKPPDQSCRVSQLVSATGIYVHHNASMCYIMPFPTAKFIRDFVLGISSLTCLWWRMRLCISLAVHLHIKLARRNFSEYSQH